MYFIQNILLPFRSFIQKRIRELNIRLYFNGTFTLAQEKTT